MHIAIDAREAYKENPTGKGLFTRHLIQEFQKRNLTMTLFLEEGQQAQGNIKTFPRGIRWHFAVARFLKKQTDTDLYLSPASYLVPRILKRRFPCAIVIHDMIAFHNEPHNRKAKMIERCTLPKVLKTAKHIFTVSEATKTELLERYPRTDQSKITVINEGPTIVSRNSDDSCHPERRRRVTQDDNQIMSYFVSAQYDNNYILNIGTLCPRKNQLLLIKAFNALPDDIKYDTQLILVGGRGWDDAEIIKRAEESKNIEWRGYVPDDELISLLQGAMIFAYPSLCEGFGLPVLDALSLGIPTITSDCSSLPEVAGDAALLVADPKDEVEICDALKRLLTDEELRRELSSKGPAQAATFTWKKTADYTLNAIAN